MSGTSKRCVGWSESFASSRVVARCSKRQRMDEARSLKTVLVTGSSTGIGRAAALRLDAYGWRVFAGVRNEEDAHSIARDGSRELRPVFLDITSDESIRSAVEAIGQPLHGLVNNAGITVQAPLEYLPPDEMRRQLEV